MIDDEGQIRGNAYVEALRIEKIDHGWYEVTLELTEKGLHELVGFLVTLGVDPDELRKAVSAARCGQNGG